MGRTLTAVALAGLVGLAAGWSLFSPSAQYERAVGESVTKTEAKSLRENGVPALFVAQLDSTIGIAPKDTKRNRRRPRHDEKLVDAITCLRDEEAEVSLVAQFHNSRESVWYSRPVLLEDTCEALQAGVNQEYLDAVVSSGLPLVENLGPRTVGALARHDLSPEFLEYLAGLDLDSLRLDNVLALDKIDRSRIDELVELEFTDPWSIEVIGQEDFNPETLEELKASYTQRKIAFFVQNNVAEYAAGVARLLPRSLDESTSRDQYTSRQVRDLGQDPRASLELLEAVLGEEAGNSRRGKRFLELFTEAVQEHGLDVTYAQEMHSLGPEINPWVLLSLSNVDASKDDVQRLLDAGYEHGLSDIIAHGAVDYAVRLSEMSGGSVWGGYIRDLKSSGVPEEYIATLSRAGIAGEYIDEIHRSGAPADEIVAISTQVPILDQKLPGVWRAGIRAEMIPALSTDPTVRSLLEIAADGEYVADSMTGAGVAPSVYMAHALVRAAVKQELVE